MRTTPPTTESLRQGATPTARRRTHDPAIGMVAGLDDPAADFTRSGRDAFQRPDPLGMLGHVPAQRRPQRQERSLPYVRFALCFAAFCAVDVAVFLYVMPRWDAATVEARAARAARARPMATTVKAATHNTDLQQLASDPTVHDSRTLTDGLRCSGGVVYRTAERDGIKEITVLMDRGEAVRCR